jgi:hypothetical protein
MLSERNGRIVGYIAVSTLLILIVSCAIGVHGEICEYNKTANHDDCSVYTLFPFILIEVFKTFDFYGTGITTLATVAIAAFTCVLYFATSKSARITDAALTLARDEFIAVHRPRIIVRFIQGPFDDADKTRFVWVTIVNVGVNRATVEKWGGDLPLRVKGEWWPPGIAATPQPITPFILASGERHTFKVTQRPHPDGYTYSPGIGKRHLVGAVRYKDESGIERETAFFRIYDDTSDRFVHSDNEEQEYQD